MKFKSLIIIFLVFGSSCNNPFSGNLKFFYDDYSDCDYSNCNGIEPFYTNLYIKFTRNDENPNPDIYIMSGFYEDGVIIDTISTDTVTERKATILVKLNYQYTVFIKYKDGDKNIVAIDGAFVKKKSYLVCDSICWQVKNNDLNVKLKF